MPKETDKTLDRQEQMNLERRRSLNQRRRSSRPKSSELIKILKETEFQPEKDQEEQKQQEFDLPEYSYRQLPPLSMPIQRQESIVKEQNLI